MQACLSYLSLFLCLSLSFSISLSFLLPLTRTVHTSHLPTLAHPLASFSGLSTSFARGSFNNLAGL